MGAGFGYVFSLALLPQLIIVGVALVCALLAIARPRERPDLFRWLACIGLLGAIAACGFVLYGMRLNRNGIALQLWNGGLTVDHFSQYITVSACVFALVTCLVSDTYIRRIRSRSGAFFALVLLATTAVSALASQHEVITFFVALQLLLLAMTGIASLVKQDEDGAAAAWRILIDGVVASAVVLYGIAILYGATGSDSLNAVPAALQHAPALVALGAALLVLGLTFFAGVFPLRRWLTSSVELLPAVPAGFVVTMGVTGGAVAFLRAGVSGLGGTFSPWNWLTSAVVLIALAEASFLALRGRTLRGLVAAIVSSQSALLLFATLATPAATAGDLAPGAVAFLFAAAVFGLSTVAVFAVLAMLQTAGLGDTIADIRGLAHRSPGAALLLAFALATLAGAPPLAGFVARLFIVEAGLSSGYGWLAVVAIVTVVVAAVPLLRLVASMYAEPGDDVPFTLAATPRLGRMVTAFCCLAALFLTVLAQPLLLLSRAGAGPIP